MSAAAWRAPGNLEKVWLAYAALLTMVLLCLVYANGPSSAAGDREPTTEEMARYREWYKHQRMAAAGPGTDTTPEDVARFVDWYKHEGALKSTGTPAPPPAPADIVRFQEWSKHNNASPRITAVSPVEPTAEDDNAARFLEAYRHRNAPASVAEPAPSEPTPEAVARFVEWHENEGVPRQSMSPIPPPAREDVIRFLAWYQRNGAPTPAVASAPVASAPSNLEVARYLEAYQRSGTPTPHVVPVVTTLEVQPIYDRNVQPAVAPEAPILLPPPLPVPVVQQPRPVPVPPPPPHPLEAPKELKPIVAASPPAPLPPVVVQPPPPTEIPFISPFDAILQQAGCLGCGTGGGLLSAHPALDNGPAPSGAGPGCNCGSGNCIPGRLHGCAPCESNNVVGRFLCGVYECICCPDPCYDPHWIPLADAAFFVESARPQTQQKVGWDAGRNLTNPDAAEFFWARADGKGRGPNPANHANPNGLLGESRVNYNDLWMYTEAALGNIGTFVYLPYRSLDGDLVGHAAGFSDVQVGTKTLLFDCELLQIAFEFRTYIPSGNAAKGLGTGHVSLEPAMIVGVKVAPETYFQGQLAEWIPLGGDQDYEGAILHYHMSLNQVLCRILPDVPLVGTAEFNGYSFQHGQFTDPVAGEERITGRTYISIGPGLRLFVCDKIDFGVGTAFAVTDKHFAEELIRSEFRWRF